MNTVISPNTPKRRWTEVSPHPALEKLIAAQSSHYIGILQGFLAHTQALVRISKEVTVESPGPCWCNDFFSGLDAVSLYGFIAERKPMHYLEIGSGNSTMFASQAIKDHRLMTRIISIDPQPRASIDGLCNEVVRQRLENIVWQELFSLLQAGDIVFLDGSHRTFQNSDVTVFFNEILPALPPGVLVGIHDICLPADYPLGWEGRFYSEQYMLACWLLADAGRSIHIELPVWWVSNSPQAATVRTVIDPLWQQLPAGIDHGGGIFWMYKR